MIELIIVSVALLLAVQSLISLYLMLYTWENPERLEASSGPRQFRDPELSFTVLLPARHEEAVIYRTIEKVWTANYPQQLLEVVVICHEDDTGTIAEAQRAIRVLGASGVHVETFRSGVINKPRGLNVGLQCTTNSVVTIFDAEDDVDSEIFNVVNTIMLNEDRGIVQSGVQLMNFDDHWFSVHNCLEYFFWFKSRLHFHADVGMIPLGGNTVFFKRELLNEIGGWDDACLTEDADVGLRLSALGQPIRVVYDSQHVTREETPHSVEAFIKQRTRWHQGFLQVLKKDSWRRLPTFKQRLLALYTLSYPIFQAFLALLWPIMIISVLALKVHMFVAMISFLPLYALGLQFVATVVGVYVFAAEFRLRVPRLMPVKMAITFLPYQLLLAVSAVRAVVREGTNRGDWEKTAHHGAHRKLEQPEPVAVPARAAMSPGDGFVSNVRGLWADEPMGANGKIVAYFSVVLVLVLALSTAMIGKVDRSISESATEQAATSVETPVPQAGGQAGPAAMVPDGQTGSHEPSAGSTPPAPSPSPASPDAGSQAITPSAEQSGSGTPSEEDTGDPEEPELRGVFASFWNANRGAEIFGAPQSSRVVIPAEDGQGEKVVQYFETHRMEIHTEFEGTPYEVQLGRLGFELARDLGLENTRPFRPIPYTTEVVAAGCAYFPPTSHSVCGDFYDYWSSRGLDFGDPGISFRESLALFGYPISEAHRDESGLMVQYFERARLEFDAATNRVVISPLGSMSLALQTEDGSDSGLKQAGESD